MLKHTQIHLGIYYCGYLGVNLLFFPPLPQGEIASCAGPALYLWNMKGHLLTSIDASCGPQPDILCVLFTQRHEWDSKNVIATGCADGVIRVKTFFCLRVDDRTVGTKVWRYRLISSIWGANLHMLVVPFYNVNWPSLGCGHPYHTHTQMSVIALLLARVLRRWRICECVCHYLELCLIWPLVTCLSRRYGRRSTPEHNYLALQKSPCPRGRMEQSGTVMSRGDAAVSPDESLRRFFLSALFSERKLTFRLIRSILKRTVIIFNRPSPSWRAAPFADESL